MKTIIFTSVFLLLLTVLTGCGNPGKNYNVTFRAIVKNPAEQQKVFLSGNQSQLADWKPDSLLLDKIDDSTFTKTISFNEGTNLEFKVNAGNWWLEALDSNQQIYNNFKLQVTQDTVFTVIVYFWKNTFLNGKFVFTPERFNEHRTIMILDDYWKYHPGDSSLWAEQDFDDSHWKTVRSKRYRANDPPFGWYRFHFIADSALWNSSLALRVDQLGASQIYYNGRLLYAFGETGDGPETFKPLQVRDWKELKIEPKTEQLLAVKYANYNWEDQQALGFSPGFTIQLKDINSIFKQVNENVRDSSYHQFVFTLIPFILFFLHIFIFAFNRRQKEHLFYALSLLGFAGVTFFSFQRFIETDPASIILQYQLNGISVPIAIFFGLMTFYALIDNKLPRRWKIYFGVFLALSVLNFWLSRLSMITNYLYIGIVTVDIISTSFRDTGKKKLKGRWIVFAGFIILAVFILLQVLLDFNILSALSEYNQVFVWGMIGFVLSMSLFLSYNFSQINKDLQAQLAQVKHLSGKTLEQEKKTARLVMERRIIEAENERKTKELEEARKFQLSILPKSFPQTDDLEISAKMITAVEVGGDYYDYFLPGDGSITLTIGDATGHGLKAGIMVTLVKSLFNTMAHTYFIPDFFNYCTKIIKKMNLGILYMGLTVLKFDRYKITASAAGMPPFLIYRKNTHSIEEVVLKGMPLGAFNDFQYQQEVLKVAPGDVILLQTDGLVELYNEKREMIDYEFVKNVFLNSASKEPSAIIEDLLHTAETWLNEFPQTDDITFLVVKIK